MKTYMENLHDTMLKCNRYSYEYGDGKAWDNRKCKTFRRHVPRGNVYMRLTNLEDRRWFERLQAAAERLAESLKTGG